MESSVDSVPGHFDLVNNGPELPPPLPPVHTITSTDPTPTSLHPPPITGQPPHHHHPTPARRHPISPPEQSNPTPPPPSIRTKYWPQPTNKIPTAATTPPLVSPPTQLPRLTTTASNPTEMPHPPNDGSSTMESPTNTPACFPPSRTHTMHQPRATAGSTAPPLHGSPRKGPSASRIEAADSQTQPENASTPPHLAPKPPPLRPAIQPSTVAAPRTSAVTATTQASPDSPPLPRPTEKRNSPHSQAPTSHTPTSAPPPILSTDSSPDSQSVILIRRRNPTPPPPVNDNAPPTAHPSPGPPRTHDKNRSAQPSPGMPLDQTERTRQQRHRQTSIPPLASSRSPPPILNDADRGNLQHTRCSSATEFPKKRGSIPTDPSLRRLPPHPTTVVILLP